jgi:16S rRNA (adenine(1408)-N(1))-methyltransferase
VIVDLGTGDGRAVLAAAARDPGALVLGVDAVAASMAEASRRAARSPTKGGLPNALFVVSAVEALPAALDAGADEVTVLLPWGSLLRGALGLDEAVAGAIARLVKVGGSITMLLSVAERDGIAEVPCLDEAAIREVARRQAGRGLELVRAREATAEDVAATRSSWARRLGSDPRRRVWLLEFRRRGPAPRGSFPAK